MGQGGLQEIQLHEMMLLTTTSFQRHFLETLACYMYFTKFFPSTLSNVFTNHPVDLSLMGTITSSLDVAIQLNQLGAPVWLVHPPEAISKMMNIESRIFKQSIDPSHLVPQVYPGTICIFSGHPSAIRNRICQMLRLKNIQIPHSTYEMQPRDDYQPTVALMPGAFAAFCFV